MSPLACQRSLLVDLPCVSGHVWLCVATATITAASQLSNTNDVSFDEMTETPKSKLINVNLDYSQERINLNSFEEVTLNGSTLVFTTDTAIGVSNFTKENPITQAAEQVIATAAANEVPMANKLKRNRDGEDS